MQCPECKSEHIRKNGKNRQGKQNYVCVDCARQFITDYDTERGHSEKFKRECLKMYVNDMGFRAIKRVKVAPRAGIEFRRYTFPPSHGGKQRPQH